MERDDKRHVVRALRRGIELGMTHIDTAEMYGSGRVETIVAEAIEGLRDRVFLASKVLPYNATENGAVQACEASLRRLRVDVLDLYLLHWPGPHSLEGTIRAFERLKRDGKIRHYGVSNFDEEELEEAVRLAGAGRIACNQVLVHLEERAVEHAVLSACERLGVTLVAYSPFGSGRFPSPGSAGGRVLCEIAEAHGATPRQVALAFLHRRPSVVSIPKSSVVAHVEENAGAAALTLSPEEIARLDRAFPLGRRRPGVPML
jgi:diketogulonate reductase-like aldo/keto reductase